MTISKPALILPWTMRQARQWLAPLVVLTLLGGLLSIFRLSASLGQPFPEVVLLWRKEYKLFTVSWITPPYWQSSANGLRINDRILCIDDYVPNPNSAVYGIDPRDTEHPCLHRDPSMDYTAIFQQAYQSVDPTIDILIDRDGKILTVTNVPLTKFSLGNLVETLAPTFLLGLALVGLGWVVYRANPEYEINLVFGYLMLAASNFTFFQPLGSRISVFEFETGSLPMLLFVIPCTTFTGPMIFHLSNLLASPGPLSSASRLILRPFYLLGIIFLLIGCFNFTFNDAPVTYLLTWVYLFWIAASWSFSTLWALVSLFLANRRATRRRVRMQTGLVLVALLLTMIIYIPFVGLFLSNSLTFAYMQGLPYLALVSLGLIAYAILRYQLFSARTQILTALLVLVGSVIAALVVYLPAGTEIGFVPLLAASLLAGSVFAGRVKPLHFLDRVLHPTEQDYQVISQFSQRLRQPQSMGCLAEEATAVLKDEFETEQADLWLYVPEQSSLVRYCEGCPAETHPINEELKAQIVSLPGPMYTGSPAAHIFNENLPDSASLHSNGIWLPLSDHEQAVGLLYIGPRWTDEVYSEADLRLVTLLGAQISLALANTRRLERMQTLQSLILLAEENERYKIARELHDTVLQFLLVLTFGLDGIKGKLPQVSAQVDEWQGRISAESSRLRDLLSYLRTPETLGQQGLLPSLETLLNGLARQTTTRLEWELDAQAEPVLSNQSKVALYRVMREAVHNSLKHACARKVVVRLWLASGRVLFHIQDDGQGFDIALSNRDTGKGYNSLHDMRIYIESTGGQLEINSMPSQGTTIQGWVPALPIG